MTTTPSLPPRYEIRPLTTEHVQWASALSVHSMVFTSAIWPLVYPEDKTARLWLLFDVIDYLVRHQILSGHSLGVFDTQYQYKHPEAKAKGGTLLWKKDDLEATEDDLLEQMDFPLVSVTLAYDSFNPMDVTQLTTIRACLPGAALFRKVLADRDARDPESWVAKGMGEVLFRSGTVTKKDYQGCGLMAATARLEMDLAARQGFRAIQIESASDAVTHVWSNPPPPFTAQIVSEANTATYTDKDENGAEYHPFYPARQRITRVYCQLK